MTRLDEYGSHAPSAQQSAHRSNTFWFSDLQFHWNASVTVRKTGIRITLKELTVGELSKFLVYFCGVLWQGAFTRLKPGKKYSIWFAPSRPRPWYIVWSAVTLSGSRIVKSEAAADAVFFFNDATFGEPPQNMRGNAINSACTDISKTTVARKFGQVFGYPLALDPRLHIGSAVEKSESNGRHDGCLVTCPINPKPGKSYQFFIDSSDGTTALDYRTTIINKRALFVLVKTKPAPHRFSIHNNTVKFAALDAVFSRAEVKSIEAFAQAMRLDWAALDILRDRNTGRIYIVDVNTTDTGPAVDLCRSDCAKLKSAITTAFVEMITDRARSNEA
jgi:hypothetical protein